MGTRPDSKPARWHTGHPNPNPTGDTGGCGPRQPTHERGIRLLNKRLLAVRHLASPGAVCFDLPHRAAPLEGRWARSGGRGPRVREGGLWVAPPAAWKGVGSSPAGGPSHPSLYLTRSDARR